MILSNSANALIFRRVRSTEVSLPEKLTPEERTAILHARWLDAEKRILAHQARVAREEAQLGVKTEGGGDFFPAWREQTALLLLGGPQTLVDIKRQLGIRSNNWSGAFLEWPWFEIFGESRVWVRLTEEGRQEAIKLTRKETA